MKRNLSAAPGKVPTRIPRHVAIIMDGNGRWAERRGLPRRRGHQEGAESARVIVRECVRSGVEELTLYLFSTENWLRRPRVEVIFLMGLLRRFLISERKEMMDNNIQLRAIGRLDALPARVQLELEKSITASRNNTGMILRMALHYGGRQEILDAAKRVAAQAQKRRVTVDSLTVEDFGHFLYDTEMTNPDLLIRTGGEMRISNFLLWQLSYTELWFTKTCWPAFRTPHLRRAFWVYAHRERRYGGLPGGDGSKKRARISAGPR